VAQVRVFRKSGNTRGRGSRSLAFPSSRGMPVSHGFFLTVLCAVLLAGFSSRSADASAGTSAVFPGERNVGGVGDMLVAEPSGSLLASELTGRGSSGGGGLSLCDGASAGSFLQHTNRAATASAGGVTLYLGTGADEVFFGTAGPDLILARGGDDIVCAGGGDDTILGGPGRDQLYGGPGLDVIDGGRGEADLLAGGSERDFMRGQRGRDLLFGEGGSDVLTGGGGNDVLVGGLGDDLARGGADNDQIWAGLGFDFLQGGNGNDVCVDVDQTGPFPGCETSAP